MHLIHSLFSSESVKSKLDVLDDKQPNFSVNGKGSWRLSSVSISQNDLRRRRTTVKCKNAEFFLSTAITILKGYCVLP